MLALNIQGKIYFTLFNDNRLFYECDPGPNRPLENFIEQQDFGFIKYIYMLIHIYTYIHIHINIYTYIPIYNIE